MFIHVICHIGPPRDSGFRILSLVDVHFAVVLGVRPQTDAAQIVRHTPKTAMPFSRINSRILCSIRVPSIVFIFVL